MKHPEPGIQPEQQLDECLGDIPPVEKSRNESIGKNHLSAKPEIRPQASTPESTYQTHSWLDSVNGCSLGIFLRKSLGREAERSLQSTPDP